MTDKPFTAYATYIDNGITRLACNMTRRQAAKRALAEAELDECTSVHISDDEDRTWDWDFRRSRWVRA